MGKQDQSSTRQTWQDALDRGLLRHLMQPVVQPGLIGDQPAGTILWRSQEMAGHLPLLDHLIQSHSAVEGFPAGQAPIAYARRQADDVEQVGGREIVPVTALSPQRPVVRPRALRPIGPRPVPGADNPRAMEAGPVREMPIVQAGASRPVKPAASSPQATVQRAVEAPTIPPPGEIPVVQTGEERRAGPMAVQAKDHAPTPGAESPRPVQPVVRPREYAAKAAGQQVQREPALPPARVTWGNTGTADALRPAWEATPLIQRSPVRPVVAPSRSAGQAGVIQRAPDRPVLVEDRPPGWPGTPPPQALQRPGPVSNQGQPAGQRAASAVVQRAASGPALSAPVSAAQVASSVIQRANAETEVDLEKLAERVQRELDLEALVARVQRQLKQRLAVESERRGWIQWP